MGMLERALAALLRACAERADELLTDRARRARREVTAVGLQRFSTWMGPTSGRREPHCVDVMAIGPHEVGITFGGAMPEELGGYLVKLARSRFRGFIGGQGLRNIIAASLNGEIRQLRGSGELVENAPGVWIWLGGG
jgi:hypothetical protein